MNSERADSGATTASQFLPPPGAPVRRISTILLLSLAPFAMAQSQLGPSPEPVDASQPTTVDSTPPAAPGPKIPPIPALHLAARSSDIVAIQTLLGQGVDVNLLLTEGEDWLTGSTPLMWAAREGDAATVKFLLDAGANPRIRTADGATALMWAVTFDEQAEKARLLLDAGAETNVYRREGTPLMCWAAGFANEPAVMEMMLDHGGEIEARMAREGLTPLMVAARAGNTVTIPVLVARGAKLEARSEKGLTPLAYAAEGATATPEAIETLVKLGADIEARDPDGTTPLMIACQQKVADRAIKLIELGADVSAVNNRRETALLYAAQSGNIDAALALLNAGADPNDATNDGVTPLMVASMRGQPAIVRLLISRGADVNAANREGWTPLLLARLVSTAEPLIDAGADLNARTVEGWTAAHFAAEEGNLFLLRKLANAGADLTIRDRAGNNAVLAAAAKLAKNPELKGQAACIEFIEERLAQQGEAATP